MPLYDFRCPDCGATFEDMAGLSEATRPCPVCAGPAKRLISANGAWREDAPWIDSVTTVAEHGSGRPHVEAFLAAPSRSTYRDWMRGERIRPQEPGEGRHPSPDLAPVQREVLGRFRARSAHCCPPKRPQP